MVPVRSLVLTLLALAHLTGCGRVGFARQTPADADLGDNDAATPGDAPRCGNGVVESGEQCDGTVDCDPYCHTRDRCLQFRTSLPAECDACRCRYCATELDACVYSPDPTLSSHCGKVVQCAASAGCSSTDCYCGTDPNCDAPNGPCRTEIERAAAAARTTVPMCRTDPNCATYRSTRLADCVRRACGTQCGI